MYASAPDPPPACELGLLPRLILMISTTTLSQCYIIQGEAQVALHTIYFMGILQGGDSGNVPLTPNETLPADGTIPIVQTRANNGRHRFHV